MFMKEYRQYFEQVQRLVCRCIILVFGGVVMKNCRIGWGSGIFACLFAWNVVAGTATVQSLSSIKPPAEFDNIHVQPLSSDKHASEYLIFVRRGVKAHYHASHSETLYIIEGRGKMQVGDQLHTVGAGSFLKVPEGVVHGLEVTSTGPLVALSVQAPEFNGKDRIFVE